MAAVERIQTPTQSSLPASQRFASDSYAVDAALTLRDQVDGISATARDLVQHLVHRV
jgi:hypothetical protein